MIQQTNLKPMPEPIYEESEIDETRRQGTGSPLQNQYLQNSEVKGSELTSSYQSSDYTSEVSKSSPESQQRSPSDMFSYSQSEMQSSNGVGTTAQLAQPYFPP